MSYRYYDSTEENSTKFEHGDFQLEVKSKSEKYEGMCVRKIGVKHSFKQDEAEITHIQELKWDDNRSPDHDNREGIFERINYLLQEIKSNRDKNPEGSVLVHCR